MIAWCSCWVMNKVYGIKVLTEWEGPYSKCETCPECIGHPEQGDLISEVEMYKLFVTDPVERMAIEIHE